MIQDPPDMLAQPQAAVTPICDPISLEIIVGALSSAQLEMETVLERTAMCPFIKEKKDYLAAFYDAEGRMVAGTVLPIFGQVVEPILEFYPLASMRPGDIYWYSDCYQSKGAVSHNSDQVIVAPVFADGKLSAFAQTWAHLMDVGGMRAGSLSPDATDIFQEGLIIPPVRIGRDGVINNELMRLFERNSRFPDMLRGDMRALFAATGLGAQRLAELFARFGTEIVESAFRQLIQRTSIQVKARFNEIFPDGEYSFTDTVDSDGKGNGPFHVRVRLTVAGGRADLDMTETDDQAPGPINFLMHDCVPSLMLGMYLTADQPHQLLNDGAMRVLDTITTRPGSLVAPIFPAPLGQRSLTMLRVQSALTGLVNVATNGNGPAASSTYSIYYLRGINPRTGERFLMQDGVGAGYGARPFADGHDVIYFVGQENYPVEYLNSSFPVRMRRYAIHADSGGPGRWRGGCGVIREFELLCDEATLSLRIGNVVEAPYGVAGGLAAGAGRAVVNPGTDRQRDLAPLSDGTVLRRGDILRIETGGGGGWGHPYDRPAEQVRLDVLRGFVSAVAAERDYGVTLVEGEDGLVIDQQATLLRRGAERQTGLFHRHGYVEAFA